MSAKSNDERIIVSTRENRVLTRKQSLAVQPNEFDALADVVRVFRGISEDDVTFNAVIVRVSIRKIFGFIDERDALFRNVEQCGELGVNVAVVDVLNCAALIIQLVS